MKLEEKFEQLGRLKVGFLSMIVAFMCAILGGIFVIATPGEIAFPVDVFLTVLGIGSIVLMFSCFTSWFEDTF